MILHVLKITLITVDIGGKSDFSIENYEHIFYVINYYVFTGINTGSVL